MPHDTDEIVSLLSLEERAEDRFVGTHPRHSLLTKAYGGQIIAQALVAATATVDPAKVVHSLQASCFDASRQDMPMEYEVERVRDGRSFSFRSVRASQGGRPVLHLLASYQPPEPGFRHQATMPVVPGPEGLPALHTLIDRHSTVSGEEWRQEWNAVDIRWVAEHLVDIIGRAPSTQQFWVKTEARLPDSPLLHRHAIGYLSDLTLLAASLLPHGFFLGDVDIPRATISHDVWFHEDARADEWLLVDQSSAWAGGARGLSTSNIFSTDGRHVASVAQEGLVRPLRGLRLRLGMDTNGQE